MTTCGYICPVCEGSGYDNGNHLCTWCTPFSLSARNSINEDFPPSESGENTELPDQISK